MTSNYSKPLSYWKRFSPTAYRNWEEIQSVKQRVAIRSISNSQHIDSDRASLHLFGCIADNLNKAASATFIHWLKQQPRQIHISHALLFCPVDECYQLQTERDGAVVCGNGHSFEIINRPLNEHHSLVM
jgi:hypothetical protein